MLDNIELVDRSYNNASNTGRIHSNLIRLKKTSFSEVSKKYANFRIALLNKKLDRVNSELEAEVSNMNIADNSYEDVESKILAKTAVIARLEEKIKVLSKENVPSNYVNNRAIKLKNAMIENLYKNSSSAYSTPEKQENNVSVGEVVAAAGNTSDIDVEKTSTENADALANKINNAMEQHENNNQATIDKNVIRNAIDESFSQLNNMQETENEDIYETPVYEPNSGEQDLSNLFNEKETKDDNEENAIIPNEEVSEKQNEVNDDSQEKATNDFSMETISREEIENVINEKLAEQARQEENITRVSTNEAAPARINAYDESGEPKRTRTEYKPMTDAEIEQARQNIEYDKYEEIYARERNNDNTNMNYNFTAPQVSINKPLSAVSDVVLPHANVTTVDSNVKDDVVVTPNRDEVREQENDIHFDYSEATTADIRNAANIENSLGGLEALKARALKLREEQRQSKDELNKAKQEQTDEAKRALEIKNAAYSKQQDYEAYLSKLNDYCEALQQDIEVNRNSTAVAREDVECNRRFIKSQEIRMDDYDKGINDINSIISPEAVNVVRVGR